MVKLTSAFIALACAVSSCMASPVVTERAVSATCPRYTIINTRGTGERQGPSTGFTTMNSRITAQLQGGQIYSTVYAADFSQQSSAGTADIVRKVTSTLASDPTHCFYLEGYSQGAAATVNALERLTGNAFDAVKGVFLIGNPEHKSGLACNVDTNGGTTTKFVNGLSAFGGGIPSNWVSKTLDVCNYGDGVCDTTHGYGINAAHLAYPRSTGTQNQGYEFAIKQLA
uniref:Cutinase-like enzyme n=1 Tax=Cryptococcus sp. BPD1A TaxID=1197862 RepID=A0A060N5H2_9TREE|nr:cutinase-like enzyme [Cryptococcus sp. BPD1A]BAN42607.1 cutinase-like enzyme [Cryptococcus sp. BPD1A]